MIKNNITLLLTILTLSISVFISSCTKDAEPTPDIGYAYFPLETGTYVDYEVDSIVRNKFYARYDTFHYQLRTLIDTVFQEGTDRLTAHIVRFKRNYPQTGSVDAQPWLLNRVWSASRTKSYALVNEENLSYVKLSFPVIDNNRWNGNAYNILNEQEYLYQGVNQAYVVGKTQFDSTANVLQQDQENLIAKQFSQEVYAKRVGLVYKEWLDVKADSIIPGKPLLQRISEGVIYKQRFLGSGKLPK